MNPWATPDHDWDEFARTCLANSERWFPALHDDAFGLVVHMTLGLAGEVGELVEAGLMVAQANDSGDLALELADVVTYALDIAAALGIIIDTTAVDIEPTSSVDVISIAAGHIANIVKKANRDGNIGPMAYLREERTTIGKHISAIINEAEFLAHDLGTFDLVEVLERKIAICEERWG